MARINFPENFLAQQELFKTIKLRHTADAAASPLLPYLAQQNLDFGELQTKTTNAKTLEDERAAADKEAEKLRRDRDAAFNPVFTRLKGGVQFLKSFYRGNLGVLGEWGITVNNTAKIEYPSDFLTQALTFRRFAQKHSALAGAPGGSPLAPYVTKQGINMVDEGEAETAASASHAAMNTSADLAENKRAQRDLQWIPVMEAIRGMANYLKTLNSDNPKALGDWGITVDDNKREPRVRSTALKIGESITINGATIGGMFTNVGAADLYVYRGKTAVGQASIINAGGVLPVLKGWSIITVVNPSMTVPGKFTVTTSNN